MKRNIGTTDRTIRAVAGIAIGAYYQSWWGPSAPCRCSPL